MEVVSGSQFTRDLRIHFMLRASEVKDHSFVFIRVCAALCLVAQSCPIFCDSTDCSPPGSSVHGDSPGKNTGVGCPGPPPGDLPNPGIKPRSPTLQADSLPAEPEGKPKNTGVGSLFLLQRIFLTQESNQGLLHCRRILYQLSYRGRLTHTHRFNQRLAI